MTILLKILDPQRPWGRTIKRNRKSKVLEKNRWTAQRRKQPMSSGKEMWSLKMFGAFIAQLLEPRSTIVAGAHESQQRSADRVPLTTFRLFIPPLFFYFWWRCDEANQVVGWPGVATRQDYAASHHPMDASVAKCNTPPGEQKLGTWNSHETWRFSTPRCIVWENVPLRFGFFWAIVASSECKDTPTQALMPFPWNLFK